MGRAFVGVRYGVRGDETRGSLPAPTATLAIPRQSERIPSVDEILPAACAIPEYIALGDGLTICILVYRESGTGGGGGFRRRHTLIASIGYMTVCSCYGVSAMATEEPRWVGGGGGMLP